MNEEEVKSLKTIGWVSYILHLIVAVGAVMPGAQASLALLLVALVIDLVKRKSFDVSAPTGQTSTVLSEYGLSSLAPGAQPSSE